MPSSKRNKSKKSTSATPTATDTLPPPDDELMVDLFLELDSRDKQSQQESVTEPQDTPVNKVEESSSWKQNSKVRHLARQARKTAALAQNFAPSNPDIDAQVDREIKLEAASIKRTCDELAVQIHEINPDGHCLFSAIADQLALLNILSSNEANYATLRAAASSYISQHPDDFLPFLPSISGEDGVGATENSGLMDARQFEQYCLIIRDTAAWGGEPEILALSRAYNVPIQVIQAGTPSVVTHTPDGNLRDKLARDTKVVRISFHRRMYGLGEHYNSLRPKNPLVAVADKIHLMLS
ncbi:cysteine proteinase [Imleria badia]|nr:cysteine proteinase [Imleria badia]